jgi:hypothetical protein
MMRAVANADDHIIEKAKPIKIERISMFISKVSEKCKRAAPRTTLSNLTTHRKGAKWIRR